MKKVLCLSKTREKRKKEDCKYYIVNAEKQGVCEADDYNVCKEMCDIFEEE